MNPVFREDGMNISKGLYNQRLHDHYNDYLAANKTIDSREAFLKSKQKKPEVKIIPKVPEPEAKLAPKVFRRPASLPLKSIISNGELNPQPQSSKKKVVLQGTTPTTPLMAKLSFMSIEEKQTNIGKSCFFFEIATKLMTCFRGKLVTTEQLGAISLVGCIEPKLLHRYSSIGCWDWTLGNTILLFLLFSIYKSKSALYWAARRRLMSVG